MPVETSLAPSPQSSELTERRYVYGGEPDRPPASFAPRGNRPVKRRRRSPFNIIVTVITVSVLMVLYVANKIAVNRLVIEVSDLQSQYRRIESTNDVLRADINKKSSLERIGKMATQNGLTYPREQPVWLDVDPDRLETVKPE